jgi:hypothetical protein
MKKSKNNSNKYFEWDINYSNQIEQDKCIKLFLETSLTALMKEFLKYTDAVKEVPWWFNERALVGFFASGIIRNSNNFIALQEYVTNKTSKKKIKRGRCDLWVNYKNKKNENKRFLFESKIRDRCISNKILLKFDDKWLQSALTQAENYAENEPKEYSVNYVCCLCFTCIKTKINNYKNFIQGTYNNLELSGRCNVKRFCCFVNLKKTMQKKINFKLDKNYCYPALWITGLIK